MKLYMEVVGWLLVCLMFVAGLQIIFARLF
jgi:hypothetical protein